MRRALLVLLAVVLGVPVALVSAPAAHACSCAVLSPGELIAGSDLVAEVTVRSRETTVPTGGDRWTRVTHEVDVHHTWKGATHSRAIVTTATDGAMCGMALRPGARYLLLATEQEGEWRTGLCSGTTPVDGRGTVTPVTTDDIEAALGSGTTPTASPDVGTPGATLEEGEGGDAPRADTIAWVAGGVAGVLLLLGLALVLRRIR